VAAFRKAVALQPDLALAHNALGATLAILGKLTDGEVAFRKAIAIKADWDEAHINLANVLKQQGRFADALVVLKRGHQLGLKRADWPYPSGQWVRQAQKLVDLDTNLPRFLSGEAQPASATEGIALGEICHKYKKRYAAAVRFYAGAFDADPHLAGDQASGQRYNAACAAALAAAGQGQDVGGVGPMQWLHWRRQALTWLCADLRAWQRLLSREPIRAAPVVAQTMQHWLADADFNGVRGAEALARLPVEERAAWARLWAGVADTLERARGKRPEAKKSD
jgi:tetratricopeptide (TPR) repeat protein